MKKQVTILFAILTLVIFSACSGGLSENAEKYTAVEVAMFDVAMAPEDVSEGGITLAIDENGSAVFRLNGQDYNATWKVNGTEFTLTQGSDSFMGTKEGDTIIIENLLNMGLDIFFVKDGVSLDNISSQSSESSTDSGLDSSSSVDNSSSAMVDDGFVAPGYGTEKTVSVETLSNPSEWYGTLTISDYVGFDDVSGEYEAWAYLDEYDGKQYFEMYLNGPYDDEDSFLFLTFYIEQHDYTFFPIVDEDAIVWYAPLKEEDNTWFNPTLNNGVLTCTYEYDYDGEIFTFFYELAQIEGSDVSTGTESAESELTPESETEPESATESEAPASGEKYTIDQLREIFLTIENLPSNENTLLTYEEIRDTYFGGTDGEIQYDDPDFKSYLWRSAEDETSYVYIAFQEDDSGVINYTSMSLANIGRDG